MVDAKGFRADLFYRLNVFPLRLPALRERKEDIPSLVHHFVRMFSGRLGKHIEYIPDSVLDLLSRHHWPGNIRELQNFVERAIITSPGATLTPRPVEIEMLLHSSENQRPVTLSDAERAHILQTLIETNWVIGGRNGAAARLGLPRTTLISRMQKLGLSRLSQNIDSRDFVLQPGLSDARSMQAVA
jgi:formate hydrogenlyase transcriptional activator